MSLLAVTTPTLLTLLRLLVSPILIPFLLCYFLPAQAYMLNVVLAGVFVLFGATDFLDGYLARLWHQESVLGKLLDPLADKMLVSSTLIALVSLGRVPVFGAIIFIGREFLVMGLREVTLTYGITVPVMLSGKIKTLLQMAYLGVVILNTRPHVGHSAQLIERVLYIAALACTIFSAIVYYYYGLQQLVLHGS